MEKSTLKIVNDLVSEGEKLEIRRDQLKKDHSIVDKKIDQIINKVKLHDKLLEAKKAELQIYKNVHNKYNTRQGFSAEEKRLFQDWKSKKPFLTRLLTSNSKLEKKFYEFDSIAIYNSGMHNSKLEHKRETTVLKKELEVLGKEKDKLKPLKEYDDLITSIKEELKKIDFKTLKKDIPDKSLLERLIESIRAYIKSNTIDTIKNIKSNLDKIHPANTKKSMSKTIERAESFKSTRRRKVVKI